MHASALPKRTYLYGIENLRALAICMVVLTHCQYFVLLDNIYARFIRFVLSDVTAVFLFISGFLLHHIEAQKFNYKNFLAKKIKFVFLPYIFYMIPATAAGLFMHQHESYQLTIPGYIEWSLLVGGPVIGPLWFIPMIMLCFVTVPALLRMTRMNPWIVGIILCITLLVSAFTHRPYRSLNPFTSFIHFFSFYLSGIYLSSFPKIANKIKAHALAVAIFSLSIFTILAIYAVTHHLFPEPDDGFMTTLGDFNALMTGKIFLCLALYALFERYACVHRPHLSHIASLSFGIFFVHQFFLIAADRIATQLQWEYTSEWFMIELFFGFGGSLLYLHVAKRILKKRSKYVIGC